MILTLDRILSRDLREQIVWQLTSAHRGLASWVSIPAATVFNSAGWWAIRPFGLESRNTQRQ